MPKLKLQYFGHLMQRTVVLQSMGSQSWTWLSDWTELIHREALKLLTWDACFLCLAVIFSCLTTCCFFPSKNSLILVIPYFFETVPQSSERPSQVIVLSNVLKKKHNSQLLGFAFFFTGRFPSDFMSKIQVFLHQLTVQLAPPLILLKRRTYNHLTCKKNCYAVIRFLNFLKGPLIILITLTERHLGRDEKFEILLIATHL